MLKLEQIADGWKPWAGGECPVPLDSKPAVMWGDGFITRAGTAAKYWQDGDDSWKHLGPRKHHIIAYRPESSHD